jgi:hypothetical protein
MIARNWGWAVAETPIQAGKWHHLAVVRSNHSQLQVYIDGQPDVSAFWVGCFMPHALGFGNQGPRFGGLMDEVRIYSRALSTKELKALAR